MASSYPSYPPPSPEIIMPSMNPYPTYEPLLTPPYVADANLPRLPHGPRSQSSLPDALRRTHVLTSHIVTAAWPRVPSDLLVESEHVPPASESKEQRKARVESEFRSLSYKKRAQERRDVKGVPKREEVLYNVFNRYRRKGAWDRNGVTIVVTHAVGFPKEIWEPTYARIVQETESANGGVKVNEIWGFEAVHHGDSALVNAGKLGIVAPWSDSARDLIQFLLYYLPTNPASEREAASLPLHLARLPEGVAQRRRQNGFVGERTVVGLGHSAGAATLFLSALWEPSLYHSLVALEPIVTQIAVNDAPIFNQWAKGAIGRRATWSSREQALSLYRAAPSFSYWDPEVLATFIKYGLTETPTGVKLKTPVLLEASTFVERQNGAHIYEMLADLNPDIELRFIYSGRGSTGTGGKISTQHTAWRRPVNSSNILMPVSHLMVQESPSAVGKVIVEFLQRKYGRPMSQASHVIESAHL